MALNGISTLPTKAAKQIAKLDLSQTIRQAGGDTSANAYRVLNRYDLTLLPKAYDLPEDITKTLVDGRPWVASSPGATQYTLISLFDPADTDCYPGSGTTLTNLNGEGVNATLQNGATVTNGVIVLDGVNDYVALGAQPIKWTAGEKLSVTVWFASTATGVILGQQNTNTVNNSSGWSPAFYIDDQNKLRCNVFLHSGGTMLRSSGNVNDGAWHQAVATYDGANETFYLDGASVGTHAVTQAGYAATYYYFLGAGQISGGWPNNSIPAYLAGRIGLLEMQQRCYTGTEVSANYNKQKARFGL